MRTVRVWLGRWRTAEILSKNSHLIFYFGFFEKLLISEAMASVLDGVGRSGGPKENIMGAIFSFAIASSMSIGPADFRPTVPVNSPMVRVMEGVFVQSDHEPRVHFFDFEAERPPHMERIAVMSNSGLAVEWYGPCVPLKMTFASLRSADSFDVVDAVVGVVPDDVVGIINDDDGAPLAFVTSHRVDVVGLVVDVPDVGIEVVENFGHSDATLTVGEDDMVIGIVTVSPRGGFNVFMDHLNPNEASMLLEMYRYPQGGQPGQN